jgi:hypothetical protein
MKRSIATTCFLVAIGLLTAPSTFAQIPGPETEVETVKRGQTGFKFLSASVDARATAMGGAVTSSTVGSSSAMFYNPASMARIDGDFSAGVGIMNYLVDIKYNAASVAYRPAGGNYGVIGLSLVNVDYGDFFGTVRADNEQGFIDTGAYTPTALAIGVGYARSFTDRFSIGAHVKYAKQDLGSFAKARTDDGATSLGDGTSATVEDYGLNTIAVDFGVLYDTGFESLTIAMSTRNFSRELVYERERFELPLTFQIGVSMDVMDLTSMDPNMHSFMVSVDAQRPRDFTEHVKVGGEYTLMNILSLRGGMGRAFVGEDSEESFSVGAGLKYSASGIGFGVDYAYTDFGVFDAIQRFAVNVSF